MSGRLVERTSPPRAFPVVGAVCMLCSISGMAKLLPDLGVENVPAVVAVAALGVFLIGVGVLLLCLQIRVVVEGSRVEIALRPLWTTTLHIDDLEVTVTTTSPAAWGGIGLRRGRGPYGQVHRALIFGSGPALQLIDRGTGVLYTIRIDGAPAVHDAIRFGRTTAPSRSPRTGDPATPPIRIAHPQVHAEIRKLVPPSGASPVVQGELLRAVERLWDEAERNGNGNWNDGHRMHVDYLRVHLLDGTRTSERAQLERDLQQVQRFRTPVTATALWVRLVDAVCEWCLAHPEPIAVDPDELERAVRYGAAGPPRTLPDRPTAGLREVAAAWMAQLASSEQLIRRAAELLAETDDAAVFLGLAVLPLDPPTQEVESAVSGCFETADDLASLDRPTRDLLALRWACAATLDARMSPADLCRWAWGLADAEAEMEREVVELLEFEDEFDRARYTRTPPGEHLEARARTVAASFLHRSRGLVGG